MTFVPEIKSLSRDVISLARENNIQLATAESCTGGLIAAALTSVAGSSDVFYGGFVTYANIAKETLLDVPLAMIESDGAVSEPVAKAMAEGALKNSPAQLTIAVTGIAGPSGGTEEKPVGMICFGLAQAAQVTKTSTEYFGDLGRDEIRQQTVLHALRMMQQALSTKGAGA